MGYWHRNCGAGYQGVLSPRYCLDFAWTGEVDAMKDRVGGADSGQFEALSAEGKDGARFRIAALQDRVVAWVRTRIGASHLNTKERAMRLLEEAVELAQAEGITADLVAKQVAHVFSRPAGKPKQEAAGVACCLLAWCGSAGINFLDLAISEITRNEDRPIDSIRGSLTRKSDADLVTCEDREASDVPR